MTDILSYLRSRKVGFHSVLGVSIMGTTGAVVGFYIGGLLSIMTGFLLGAVLGGFVSILGAQVFFYSILIGTLVGGVLALVAGGPDTFVIGAGSGGAIGGFIGINIEMFRKDSSRPH